MSDLTVDERKRVQQAFNKAAMFPGFAMSTAGVLVNLLARGSHSIALPILAIVLCFGGVIIGLTMGFSARRREIAAIQAARQPAASLPAAQG